MDRQRYKALIDALVAECLTGQGQIASTRVQLGTWNASASADHLADQHDLNVLLAQLSADDRSTLASMVNGEFVAGVHAALRVLEEAQVLPSDLAFEGSAFADFAGRLGGWAWPA